MDISRIKIGTKLKNKHTNEIHPVENIEVVRVSPNETTIVFTIKGFRSNQYYINKNWEMFK
tara:strand:- start:3745 stop:3927 length:183 start_codon:yes stop_codon:yes gene_type:complete